MTAKRLRATVFFLQFSLISFASHLVGGDVTVRWVSENNYEITLTIYRDCKNANPGTEFTSTIPVGIYDLVSNDMYQSVDLSLIDSTDLSLGDACIPISHNQLCVQRGIYQGTVTLDDNTDGYYVSWERCCRNSIITNIVDPGSAGMVFYVEIPDPALKNSTPVFGSYPNAYMCLNQKNTKDFSTTDADGDSLVYSLVTPLNGTASSSDPIPALPTPGPYSLIEWETSYSEASMVGGTPAMVIDPKTGIVTAYPSSSGVFVIAVRVEEYDRTTKQKLGEIRRDIQYLMLPCNLNLVPEFTEPAASVNSLDVFAGDSVCFNLKLVDPNTHDSVFFSATSELLNPSTTHPQLIFTSTRGVKSIQTKVCIQTYCESMREDPYSIRFNGNDSSCYGKNFVTKDVSVRVYTIDGTLKDPLPNVFTPNGDNVNDFLKVNASVNNCFDTFEAKFYDRWGVKVFESTDFLFKWDGKNFRTGHELPEGVYYYVLKGMFKDQTVERRGHVTLFK